MAQIIRNGSPVSSNNDLDEAQLLAITYWGSLTNEKMFVIPFWQVSQMLAVSGSNEIALRVSNIDEPNFVSANWVVFEQAMADSLADPAEMGVRYYVIDDTYFNGPILTPPPEIVQLNGIRHINATPENNVLRARIGKNAGTGQIHIFFLAAECNIIDQGGGGGGVLAGLKVPTT